MILCCFVEFFSNVNIVELLRLVNIDCMPMFGLFCVYIIITSFFFFGCFKDVTVVASIHSYGMSVSISIIVADLIAIARVTLLLLLISFHCVPVFGLTL